VELVAADIGGNHARFALADVEKGRVTRLSEAITLRTAEHASLPTAWEIFGERLGRALPRAAAIAVACPIAGDVLKFTNNPWIIRPALIAERLGVDRVTLINDFGAVGHAVVQVGPEHLRHLCGPDLSLPERGVISIIGPGTGLGVAHVLRREGRNHVLECEGGHVDYAPLDDIEDAILARLRQRYGRVSVERIVSGPGLANIYEGLAAIEGRAVQTGDNKALWMAALAGKDRLAVVALDRFCMVLGSVAGDIALAQGANAVVIGGGLGLRIADLLPRSGFASRFTAKGRFERMMSTIPVKVITHPQPGLLGAAAAFAEEYSE
jgi:glucokinase